MAKRGFQGGGMPGNANMMKQIQKMQEDMLRKQEEMEAKEYTASSGGGAVSATVSGQRIITSLTISPDAADPSDVEMLSDLITAAVNEALRQAEEAMQKEMGKYTGGLNLPF